MKNTHLQFLILAIFFGIAQNSFSQNEGIQIDSINTQWDNLQIMKAKGFKREKFTFREHKGVPTNIWGFPIYTKEFISVISLHPYAHRELRESYKYQGVATGASVIFFSLSLKELLQKLRDKNLVNNGNLPGTSTPVVDLVNVIVSGGILVFATIKQKKHKERAIDIFNNKPIN